MNRYNLKKRNDSIWNMYRNGIPADLIGIQFGITRRAVYYVIKKYLARYGENAKRMEALIKEQNA
jgi:hypothetical protein